MSESEFYKPITIDNFEVDGVAAKTTMPGQTLTMIQKMFISSLEEQFPLIATSLLNQTLGVQSPSYVNRLLVIIKPDKKAYVYREFPFTTNVKLKKPHKRFHMVFQIKGSSLLLTHVS